MSYIYINEKTSYHPQVLIIYDLDQNGRGSGLPPAAIFVRTCMRLFDVHVWALFILVQYCDTTYMLTLSHTVIWLTNYMYFIHGFS